MSIHGRDTAAYWDARAHPHLEAKEEWRGVSVGDAPVGVATYVRRLEEEGARRLVTLLPEGRVLDAGCGYGRWFSLVAPARSVVGIDVSPLLAKRARTNAQGIPVTLGDVRRLPFADAEFEAAYTIKVLQFLPPGDRQAAIAELFRVVRPGGTVVLYEKTRGADGCRPDEWISFGRLAGGRAVDWYPNHFALLERPLRWMARLIHDAAQGHDSVIGVDVESGLRGRVPRLFALYVKLDSAALAASMLVEPLAERLVPRRFAEHGIFHFEKESP
jgi:SAM-dependent methyltransferase